MALSPQPTLPLAVVAAEGGAIKGGVEATMEGVTAVAIKAVAVVVPVAMVAAATSTTTTTLRSLDAKYASRLGTRPSNAGTGLMKAIRLRTRPPPQR